MTIDEKIDQMILCNDLIFFEKIIDNNKTDIIYGSAFMPNDVKQSTVNKKKYMIEQSRLDIPMLIMGKQFMD